MPTADGGEQAVVVVAKRGAPSIYTQDLAARICNGLLQRKEDGLIKSLRDICSEPGMPSERVVYEWVVARPEFARMYALAREQQAHMMAEDVVSIADAEPDPAKARVRCDQRKWYAAKMNKKVYADRNIHQGDDDAPPVKIEATSAPMPANEKLELARWIAFSLQQGADAANTGSVDEQK